MFASKISEVIPVTLCADSAARVLRTGRSKRGSVCRNFPGDHSVSARIVLNARLWTYKSCV
jgi:hypothetical protein